jgi:uncharacterized caspase-like protein
MFSRILLGLSLLALINPSSLPAATEQRIALVIGNSAYSSGPLKNPVNDAADMAALLKKLEFSVTLKKNATLQEMEEAIESFGNRLKRGGVGLFCYAGHGVQVNGTNYLLPIGAKINKEADVKYRAVDANKILDEMATANNGLNIVMLDACRDNPFARSFRSASRGLAIVSSAPSGTFISYSTSPGNVARDGDRRNSPYTAALLQYLQAPGLSISDVFINVRAKVKKETGQVPWELSSLEGQFYFMPGSDRKSAATVPDGKATLEREESSVSTSSATDELDDESRKLEDEDRKLEKEKALLGKKKALEEKRQKIEEEKATLEAKKRTTLAMGKRLSVPTVSDSNLVLEKTVFAPGESIRVEFYASGNWARDAWIGIIPSNISHGSESVNDQHDITYQYIENRTNGAMVFTAPGSGQWDLRMHDTDSNGREVAYISFTVR